MKVLVFHRDSGRHLAVPVNYLVFTLISAFISAGIGMGTNWYFGAAAFMVLMFALHRDFKEHEGELRQAAHDAYREKYINKDIDHDEDEIDQFDEVYNEPSEIEKDVDRYIAAYNRGYKDGRKRYESEEAIETSLNEREGYADGYKDGRGHQRRKYYE